MRSLGRPISVLLRTEHLLTRRRMAVARNQITLLICAALAAGMALIMLNLAAVFGLRGVMPPYWAALIVAAADLVVAGVIAAIALNMSAGPEAEQAAGIREQAIRQIEEEVDTTLTEIREVTDSVHRIARNPLGTVAPSILGPLLAKLLDRSENEDSDTS